MKPNLLNLFSSLSILLLATVGQSIAQTPQSDTRPRTSSIGGQVTIGGQPAANVTVTIVEVDSGAGNEYFATSRATPRREPEIFNAVTEGGGRYRLAGLAAGNYKVSASSKAYVLSNQNSGIEPVKWVTLGGAEEREDVDLSLARGGVITGRVTTANGEPIVASQVSATMTRDAEGNSLRRSYGGRSRTTDDRGVYRLYGLAPGTYIVSVRSNLSIRQISPYDGDTPTYYPSSTRDTAAEVAVVSGGEVSGVDIRYRGDRGHIISGVVTGARDGFQRHVSLINIATGSYVGSVEVQRGEPANSFAIRGVSDGEYEILAYAYGNSDDADSFVSPPRRVTVRGADAGGIELKLAPLAYVAGMIVVESQPDICETKREFSIEEAVIALRRDEKTSRAVYQNYTLEVAPDDKGEFTIRRIAPGRYFIEMRLPAENWYLKSIATAPAPAPIARKPPSSAGAARDGFVLKAGEKLSGLTVTISTGAASLSGKVIAAKEGARLPSRLRVHLAPVEAANADDPLRYAEMIVRPDRSFAFNNMRPANTG
jgi:hypothetical protein